MLEPHTLLLVVLFVAANIAVRFYCKRFRLGLEAAISILFAHLLIAEFLTNRQTIFVGMVFFLSITMFHIVMVLTNRYGLEKLAALLPVLYLFTFLWGTSNFSYQSFNAKAVLLIGYSYLCFRLLLLCIEREQSDLKSPTYLRTLDYGFFPAVLLAGPITSFASFSKSRDSGAFNCDWFGSIQVIIVGLLKLFVLSPVLNLLTFEPYLERTTVPTLNGILLSSMAYYVFLWANFSGYCDVAVGISKCVGVRIDENFNKPFLALNVQDFWARWHITLSSVMRRVIFFPIVIFMGRCFPHLSLNIIIAIGVFTTFALVGVWHGFAINYLIFGFLHGFAVAFNTTVQRRRVSQKVKAVSGPLLPAFVKIRLSQALTFIYVSITFTFFANDWETLKKLFDSLNYG
ncbi:hypothetical protein OAO72_00250 [Alphaproteobacteria bacterium]|nr:hypothetical protein [Alphaproteobacteria bacterium]